MKETLWRTYENAWPILERLRKEPLSVQRRLLRLHEEAGFTAEDHNEVNFRRALDQELGRITEFEFSAQCDPSASASDPKAIPNFAYLLKSSPPFAQYLNVYLYFGVRFAAGRIIPPCGTPGERREVQEPDCNETTVALPPPPMCQDRSNNQGPCCRCVPTTR